jgi:hypothetical protein
MTTIEKQFNDTLTQFLEELEKVFPDSPAGSFKVKLKVNNVIFKKSIISEFWNNVKNHKNDIIKNDEKLLKNFEELDLYRYYCMSDDNTKKIFWCYIKTLYILSMQHNNFL